MTASPPIRRLMWFFAIVYAVEGIGQAKAGILGQPVTYFLKQVCHWDPVRISVSLAALDIPWVIKPLWGAISDFVPLFGYRRRPYLVIANAGAVAAFVTLALIDDPATLIPVLVMTAVAMAVSSTLCGALLVETGQRHNSNAQFVNQQWLWFNIAQMLSVLAAGFLIEIFSPTGALHVAAWIAAVAPLTVLGSLRLIQEQHAGIDLAAFRSRLGALLLAFRTRNLWLVAAFLFLYYFSPGLGTPLYFEMTDRLGFSQGFIGLLASISAGGWILGGVLYRAWLHNLSHVDLLRFSIIGGMLATLGYLLLASPGSAVAIWVFNGMAAMITMIATMTLAADACPRGVEGFAFAGLMSVLNLTYPLHDALGSLLYEHVFNRQLTPLILVSATATGAVLFLIPLVTARSSSGTEVT
ncbi:MFS transporter [Rhodopila globiformis]|nr:MFS transporter [Rhodopila globiformis]